jgi:Ca-activated chloride channel homolog
MRLLRTPYPHQTHNAEPHGWAASFTHSQARTGFGPVITPTRTSWFTPRITPLVPVRRADHGPRFMVALGLAVVSAIVLVLWSPEAQANDIDAKPAESPYFHIKGADTNVDALPLKSTRVDVRIAGVIADVTVTQRYRNEGKRPIEAKYVFPSATTAAVHAMSVRIGERLITANIQEKQRARIAYEAAKKEGKTSALLEQERPNVFQMNVANILPGDDIAVELRYTELIAPTEGRYNFVFPTVVGPRYHAGNTTAKFPSIPYLPMGGAPDKLVGTESNTQLEMNVQFASPLPVSEIESTSHDLEVTNEGSANAHVTLDSVNQKSTLTNPSTTKGGPANNRDFILTYRLAGDQTATGLTLHQGTHENFFLALVEPPKAIATEQINPREYVFVVDISGSMHGYPLETSKALLRNLIGHLRPSDTFNVMLFSGSAEMLNATPVPATRANIERAIQTIERQRGGGSTEIVPALKRIAALPKNADVSRSVIVVTDGYVMVEQEVFALVRKNLGHSNVFAFGIGSSVNRHLIEGIARAGQGEAFIVTRPEHAAGQAERLRKMIEAPVLTQLRARFEGLDVYDVEPKSLSSGLPDVLGGRPVVIQGKWRGDPRGQLVLEGQSASGAYQAVVPVTTPDREAVALKHLWARSRIGQLSDQEALEGANSQREGILSLGLKYSLLTPYTSFLAVDQVVRTAEPATTVNQPLPLPQGVSDKALGDKATQGGEQAQALSAEVPSTPEPTTWLGLLMVAGVLLLVARGRAPAVRDTASPA